MEATRELLQALSQSDDRSIREVLIGSSPHSASLDRVTLALVRLAAMLAVDASTTSVRWAVEVAGCAGVDDAALVHVLLRIAAATGAAQTVACAPRLALAVGVDVEVEGWDGT
jgi:4-carboxymuconolactone decarboxylase